MPLVGRFISPDTIVPEPGNPQSFNRYSYVLNSPLNFTDPTGHMVSSGCDYESCTLDDELDPDNTWITPDGSYVLAPPHLLEQYPAEITASEVAYTAVGLLGAAAAPIIEGAVAAWPSLVSGGSAACADGDCTNELAKALEYGIKSAKELQKITKGSGLEVHHIVEQRFAPNLALKVREMLSVVLTPDEHQVFTNAWRTALGYNNSGRTPVTDTATVQQIWEAAIKVYNQYPTLLDAARKTLFGD